MLQSRPWFGVCLAGLVATSFATGSVLAGLAFRHGSEALTVTTVRAVVATIVLFIVLRLSGRPLALPPRERTMAFALGTLVAFYSWALYKAVELMPVSLAVLVFYLYPLLTGIVTWVSGAERFTLRAAGALALAFLGLTLALDLRSGTIAPLGVLAALGGAVGFTAQLLLSSRLMGRSAPQPVTLHMLASAAAIYIVISLALDNFVAPRDAIGWTAMGGTSLVYTVGAIGLYSAIALLGPMKVSLFLNSEPIISMVLGFLLLDQRLAPIQILGAACVIAAITLGRPRRPAAAIVKAADPA